MFLSDCWPPEGCIGSVILPTPPPQSNHSKRQRDWPALRPGAYGLAGAGLGLIVWSMAQIHPLQDIYFNFLVDRTTPEHLRTQWQIRSPNAWVKGAAEYLRQRHPGETLAVRGIQDEPGFRQEFAVADYALFYIWQGSDPDLAFNALPVGRAYANTLLAVKPLQASRMTAEAIAAYRELHRQAVAGDPIIRDAFAVYRQGRTLTFVRENCPVGDMERRVFVRVLKPEPGRENQPSVLLRSHGVRWDNICLALVELPADEAWGDLIIGQDWPGGYQWQQLYSRAQPGLRERIAAARRDNPRPARREGFAVFLEQDAAGQNRLLYAKENCSRDEYETRVALHIYPQNLTDLPFYRWQTGFENRDFQLRDYGGRPGGECLAAVPLPDYPGGIREIRTGQSEGWNEVIYFPKDPGPLRAEYAALSAVQPDQQAAFAVYWREGQLTYVRENCAAADTQAPFLLHIVPASPDTLSGPAAARDNRDFDFGRWGGHFDGKCLAAVPLPDYPIKEIRTGQFISGQGDLWSVELIAPADPEQLRAEYAALSAVMPAARDYFDLYWQDNRLIYLRETCAAGDTVAGFFLHIVPADAADLPADRRDAGFAHGGFDFVRWGGQFDGKCLASVPLPNYPIADLRTGQYVAGQGELWSAVITGR